MPLHHLASMPVTTMSLVAFVFALTLTGVALLSMRLLRSRIENHADVIPVPTFIGTMTTAWALALGFAAADVWTINAMAERVASAERSSISRLAGMAGADAIGSPALLAALRNYSLASTRHEWEGAANSRPSLEVESALQEVRLAIVRSAVAGVPDALIGKMVVDFDELQDARNDRLSIGAHSVSELKWYLVIFLTFLSVVTIAVIHAERPLAGRNAAVMFACTATVSLWMLMLYANPYLGFERIRPAEVNAYPFEAIEAGH